ncbi:MAG: hypothetical protein M1816_000970 [Peltula sp. TS41687]|nr:MAG: hypothetical protein M1816_000970 [Peltula sp. TS41687]
MSYTWPAVAVEYREHDVDSEILSNSRVGMADQPVTKMAHYILVRLLLAATSLR